MKSCIYLHQDPSGNAENQWPSESLPVEAVEVFRDTASPNSTHHIRLYPDAFMCCQKYRHLRGAFIFLNFAPDEPTLFR